MFINLKGLRFFTLFIVLTITQTGFSQTDSFIQSDRPGQSIGAGVVGKSVFQVQSGIDNGWSKSISETNTIFSNTVLRYGTSESFELSAVFNYQEDFFNNNGLKTNQKGLSGLHVGFRSAVIDKANGFVPTMAIQTHFKLNTVQSVYRAIDIAPVVTLSMTHNLCSSTSWTHNFGLDYDGNTSAPKYFGTSNIAHSINEKWGSFIELYGNFKNNYGSVYINSGGEYFVDNNLKIDFSAGWGNNHGTSEAFVSLGLSWRFIQI